VIIEESWIEESKEDRLLLGSLRHIERRAVVVNVWEGFHDLIGRVKLFL